MIRLDEYLILIMTYEELERAAEAIWEQYLPEVYREKEWFNSYRLAESMGLKVVFHRLHRRTKNRGLLFWRDGMVKIIPQSDGNGAPEEIMIEAGTIVVNDDGGDMKYDVLADRARYFKEHEEGVATMCKMMENMRNEVKLEAKREFARRMLIDGILSIEKIAEYSGLSPADVEELGRGKTA